MKRLAVKSKCEAVRFDSLARDKRDANRASAPTKQANDAIMIDTSELDREEMIAAVLGVIADHMGS